MTTPADTCRVLRTRVGGDAPDDLGSLARAAGIREVRLVDNLPVDGMLVARADSDFAVLLDAGMPRARQRYTLAHEIGHAALGLSSVECFTGGKPSHAERAADMFAAEAVMPSVQFGSAANELRPSIAALRHLARTFRASLESTALRVCELGAWDIVAVRWSWFARPGSTEKLRVAWSACSPGLRIYVPRFATPPSDLFTSELSRQTRLDLGSLRGTFETHTVATGAGFLTLVDATMRRGHALSAATR